MSKIVTMTKFTLWAPKTPGSKSSVVGRFDSLDEAINASKVFSKRRDLVSQDVFIRKLYGEIVEGFLGPCR